MRGCGAQLAAVLSVKGLSWVLVAWVNGFAESVTSDHLVELARTEN